MATTKKSKSKALAYVSQSRADAQADIKKLGDLKRQALRVKADLDDAIAKLTKAAAPRMEELGARIALLEEGIQAWCEANRTELCGKGKSANLITGEVAWRQRPPSISIRGADAVLECLRSSGLARFIRSKDEVNKDAMLNEPDAARAIPGVTIVTGVEDFTITPFEVDMESRA